MGACRDSPPTRRSSSPTPSFSVPSHPFLVGASCSCCPDLSFLDIVQTRMAVALASGSAISRAAGRNNDVSARRDNFDAFPDELIEHIGYYAATLDPLGPPKDLVSLQLVGRRFYNILSSRTNPRLYVLLFRATFDSDAYFRRLELEATKPENVAMEFKRRYVVLWKFRTLRHCFMEVTPTPVVLPSPLITTSLPPPSPRPLGRSSPLLSSGNHKMPSPSVVAKETLTMLWSAFLMMLENVVLNKRILKDYAKLDVWLQKFWFDPRGASCAMDAMHRDMWPPLQESSTLAMWLLWFSMEPSTSSFVSVFPFYIHGYGWLRAQRRISTWMNHVFALSLMFSSLSHSAHTR